MIEASASSSAQCLTFLLPAHEELHQRGLGLGFGVGLFRGLLLLVRDSVLLLLLALAVFRGLDSGGGGRGRSGGDQWNGSIILGGFDSDDLLRCDVMVVSSQYHIVVSW